MLKGGRILDQPLTCSFSIIPETSIIPDVLHFAYILNEKKLFFYQEIIGNPCSVITFIQLI